MFSTKTQNELSAGRVSAIKAQFEKLDSKDQTAKQNKILNNKRIYFPQMSYPQTTAVSTNNNNNINNNKLCFKTNKSNNIRVENVKSLAAAATKPQVAQLKPTVPLKNFCLPRSATSLELRNTIDKEVRPLWRQPQQLQSKEANIHHNLRRSCAIVGNTSGSGERKVSFCVEKLPLLASYSSPPSSKTNTTGGQHHGNNNNNNNTTATTTSTSNQQQQQQLTRDAVKRNSIKRSPAFRVGDKQNNAVLLKQLPVTNAAAAAIVQNNNNNNNRLLANQPIYDVPEFEYDTLDAPRSLPYTPIYQQPYIASSNSPPPQGFPSASSPATKTLSPQKLNNLIAQHCAAEQLEQLQQPGMTDSIRAALSRPLPKGPPPKKPPRISMLQQQTSSNNFNHNNSNCNQFYMQQHPAYQTNQLNISSQSCGYNSE